MFVTDTQLCGGEGREEGVEREGEGRGGEGGRGGERRGVRNNVTV